jgi:hypothetical protein
MNNITKTLVAFLLTCHIGLAMADIVIITQPNGGQTVCIMQSGVVTCF